MSIRKTTLALRKLFRSAHMKNSYLGKEPVLYNG